MPPEIPEPDVDLIENIASQLDLRKPNRDALHSLAIVLNRWQEGDSDEGFEGVIDVATGVGKTYILAASIEYFAALGVRNFAVVAPGATILRKTSDQFSVGTKSLLPSMSVQPKLITADNFDTGEVAQSLGDDSVVKLFVFTVQSLVKPATEVGRRTHKWQEGLGGAFYEHLNELEDLIVFADEHHAYYGDAFSKAVRDLHPLALVGLTATPHKKTKDEDIFFRYPLTAAIADEFVKTPVIVGRKDDLTDDWTQLRDGAALLEAKETALNNYCRVKELAPVHPIMLVNCQTIEHAEEVVAFLKSNEYMAGAYASDGIVLEIHSKTTDDALAALDLVDEPESPCRIIVQVGMLKEGWDVKSVYVIASLRASVSEILTEQTLGRGLRLPFGGYTEMPLINELDVLAHEKYSELLESTDSLRENFVDQRTAIETFMHSSGEMRTALAEETVDVDVSDIPEDGAGEGTTRQGEVNVGSAEERIDQAQRESEEAFMHPSASAPRIDIPRVVTEVTTRDFLLQEITDFTPFTQLGKQLAVDPEEYLRRTRLKATVREDDDGTQIAEVETAQTLEKVKAMTVEGDFEKAKQAVVAEIMADRSVANKRGQPGVARSLLEEALKGAGNKAEQVIASYPRSLSVGILREIRKARRASSTSSVETKVLGSEQWAPVRVKRTETSSDRKGGTFQRTTAYIGWTKGLFEQAWFDSAPERVVSNILDESDEIETWARLHRNDVPILWRGGEHTYNPDLLAVEVSGKCWLIEVKSDRDLETQEVQEKKTATLAWANYVNHSELVEAEWGYLLVSEAEIGNANDSWTRLRQTSVA